MNGKKIVLLTTLIVFLVLIGLLAIFTRFVLNIDFGGAISETMSSTRQEISSDESDESDGQSQQSEAVGQETPETGDKEAADKADKEDEEGKDDEDEEPEVYTPSADVKSAKITVEAKDEEGYPLSVDDAEKLAALVKALDALKMMSIQQSVGLQNPSWSASIDLSLSDGTAVSCQLEESAISGSKATLSTGSKTYESTGDLSAIKKLLQGWMEEEQQGAASAIAAEEFEQATRLLAVNTSDMTAQDIAGSSAQLQEALGKLKVTETLTGSIYPGKMRSGLCVVNLADESRTLYTLELYETGILAYYNESDATFYVCEQSSLDAFYSTVDQISSQYSATPAYLALMDYSALSSAEVSSTTGGSRKKVGLIHDHAQNLFYFLQQIHVVKGNTMVESQMFNRPEFHADLSFDSGTVVSIDLSKGSLLVDGGDGVIRHYTLIGDSNLELLRAEFERVTEDD